MIITRPFTREYKIQEPWKDEYTIDLQGIELVCEKCSFTRHVVKCWKGWMDEDNNELVRSDLGDFILEHERICPARTAEIVIPQNVPSVSEFVQKFAKFERNDSMSTELIKDLLKSVTKL